MMTPPDPRAVLLTPKQVAARLGVTEEWVRRARHATSPDAVPRPMAGWRNIGSPHQPRYVITEAALATYIAALPEV